MSASPDPKIVSEDQWVSERAELLVQEKELTRLRDKVSASRRRLPMVHIDKHYVFEGPEGPVTLLDLFEGRPQLILYHFMFGPEWKEGCDGCSMLVDGLCHPAHLHARGTSLALVSRARIEQITTFKSRMEWRLPWVSSHDTDFNDDFGMTKGDDECSGTSVFYRVGDEIFRTYFTTGRGDELHGSVWSLLDLTPLGRQELWEDSPEGRPQSEPYLWWKHHDRYTAMT